MNLFLILAFLFFIGSVSGWVLEVFFRRFFSKNNPERRWLNPGFCSGPYLPLYGSGLCLLYLIARLESFPITGSAAWNRVILFFGMALCMTAIEYLAGLLSLKLLKVRLWDYSREWGNVQGIICPKFSLAWAILGALYYFLIHPRILSALLWLSQNLAFSFVIGFFFGVFVLDVSHSANLVVRLRRFAQDNGVVVRLESVKEEILRRREQARQKYHFLLPFSTEVPLNEHLRALLETFERQRGGRARRR